MKEARIGVFNLYLWLKYRLVPKAHRKKKAGKSKKFIKTLDKDAVTV